MSVKPLPEPFEAYRSMIGNIARLNVDNPAWWASDLAARANELPHLLPFLESGKMPQPEGDRRTLLQHAAAQAHRLRLLAPAALRRRLHRCQAEGPCDLLLFTYLDKRGWDDHGKRRDPYWQPLLDYLDARKVRWAQVAITVADEHLVAARLAAESGPIFPIEAFMTHGDLLRAVAGALAARFTLPDGLADEWPEYLLNRWHQEQVNGLLMRHLMYQRAFVRLLRQQSPRRLLWPWENHPWERLLCLAARRSEHPPRLVGAQHTTVLLNQLRFFPPAEERGIAPLPDCILTTGERSRDILADYGAFPEGCLRPGAAIRFQNLRQLPAKPWSGSVQRLALPLTIDLSTNLPVLRMAIEAFAGTTYQVDVKAHPALPTAQQVASLGQPLPDNFTIRDGEAMGPFLARADLLLYSETTVCMEALALGIPVIYLDIGFGAAGDPLFQCPHLKWQADSASAIRDALHAIETREPAAIASSIEQGMAYISSYFRAVCDENLQPYLEA